MERKGTLSGLSGMNARNLRAIRERYTYIVRGTGVNMTILCFSVGFEVNHRNTNKKWGGRTS